MLRCSSVFQYDTGMYAYTYRCSLEEHGSEKLHCCDRIIIKDVGLGSGNKYVKADVVHWAIDGPELKILEKILPVDAKTGEKFAVITGVASEKYAGAYGVRLDICTSNVLSKWNDGHEPSYLTVNERYDLIWRA